MTTRPTVAVCGSCTSRDPFNSRFNADHARWFELTAEAFQTSMIALMAPALAAEELTALAGPDYQVRITREDASRVFLDRLVAAQPDYLVLDFFADVHFGVLRLPDGRYLTDNRWMLWPTDYYRRLQADGGLTLLRLLRDTEEYLVLWTEALDRFAAFVAERCPRTTVIVHRGLNTDEVQVPGRGWPVRLLEYRAAAPLNVERANRLWARLDEYALGKGWTAIDLRAEGYTSYADHPWKPFYVHYTPDYYHRFLAELLTLDLATRLEAADAVDDAAQVRAIAGAGHERAANQAARWTPIRHRLDARVRELEALGPLRAVKFALGQRIRQTRAGRKGAR